MRKSKEQGALETLVARLADLTAAVTDYIEAKGLAGTGEEPRQRRRPYRPESKGAIVELFATSGGRPYTAEQVKRKLRLPSRTAVRCHLGRLAADGLLQRVSRGVYVAAKSAPNGVSR